MCAQDPDVENEEEGEDALANDEFVEEYEEEEDLEDLFQEGDWDSAVAAELGSGEEEEEDDDEDDIQDPDGKEAEDSDEADANGDSSQAGPARDRRTGKAAPNAKGDASLRPPSLLLPTAC